MAEAFIFELYFIETIEKEILVHLTADQTPTPTRFIRNCEEVGLFQDLQNVNPFEETFRRAVESGNTGTLTVPEVNNEININVHLIDLSYKYLPRLELQTILCIHHIYFPT